MDCEELLAALNEYVDGNLDLEICQSFQKHLEGCNPCQVVVDNIRHSITLFKDGQPYDMPREFHDQLSGMLKECWEKKFQGKAK